MSETWQLASWATGARGTDIPSDVRSEARRAILDYLGCAIGGSTHTAVDLVVRALGPFSGNATADVLGRRERFDPLHTALLNGVSSHVNDFDDITPDNYVHPSAPLASALFAYASANHVSGSEFVQAFVLGFEVESRIGSALFPSHYDMGWHITSTVGVFGAAVAIGKLIGLSRQQMVWAIGLAATQASGQREMFGSMAKAFHPGRAAQNGYAAASLARAGFTAGQRPLEGPRGFGAVMAKAFDLSAMTAGLNETWALRRNTYKPFPCVHVSHPTIEAAIRLHDELHVAPQLIRAVRLRVAPSVLELCGRGDIETASHSKLSISHCAAVALVRGRAGLREFTDSAVNDPVVKRIRECTSAESDVEIEDRQAHLHVELVDGRALDRFVDGPFGTLERPMTDQQLEQKLREQASTTLSDQQIDDLLTNCSRIDTLDDVGAVVKATVPRPDAHPIWR
jgi:2-methylcitrate dehydratase PrpD